MFAWVRPSPSRTRTYNRERAPLLSLASIANNPPSQTEMTSAGDCQTYCDRSLFTSLQRYRRNQHLYVPSPDRIIAVSNSFSDSFHSDGRGVYRPSDRYKFETARYAATCTKAANWESEDVSPAGDRRLAKRQAGKTG